MEIIKNKTKVSVKPRQRSSPKNGIEYSIKQFRKGTVPMYKGEFQVFDVEFPSNVDLRELAYKR